MTSDVQVLILFLSYSISTVQWMTVHRKVIKYTYLTFKVNFLCQQSFEVKAKTGFFNYFLILQFLKHFIFKNHAQFLMNCHSIWFPFRKVFTQQWRAYHDSCHLLVHIVLHCVTMTENRTRLLVLVLNFSSLFFTVLFFSSPHV